MNLTAVCDHLLTVAAETYSAATVALPARQVITPGNPETAAWDCEQVVCGLVQSRTGASDAATRQGSWPAAGAGIQVPRWDLRLVVVRCVATIDGDRPPSASAVSQDGVRALRDAELLAEVLTKAPADPRWRDITGGGSSTTFTGVRLVGPQGGLAAVVGAITLS